MLRVPPLLLCLALPALLVAGCKNEKTPQQKKAEALIAWKADSKAKAARYYRELLEKYPDSEYARQAEERLQALGPVAATPKPGAKATPKKK